MSVVGLDVGTSRVKAVRFDAAWQAVAVASEKTKVVTTAAGHSEQDMPEVYAAACRVVAKVVEHSPDPIDLVAVTAQGDGCWLVDKHGEPVRPALLWNDSRSVGVVDAWERDGTLAQAFAVTGCDGAPGLANAQLRWLLDHEPETLQRAGWLLSCGSWIYHRFTGRYVLDISEAANPFLDAKTLRYSPDLLDLFGLGACARLLPEVVSGHDRVAFLGSDAARALALPAGTPVVLAPYDVPATAFGLGAVEVGQAFAVLGTTLCVGVVTDDPRLSRARSGMTLPGPGPQRWLLCHATMIGTEVLDWAADLLGLGSTAELTQLAATARPGGQPLLLPYLSPAGERSPFRDTAVRGSLLGLTIRQTRADVARAVVDGLTLAVRDCLTAAGPTDTLALCGGGAASPLWRQAICDAIGRPVTAPDAEEITARGAAVAGALALGIFDSPADAAGHVIRDRTEHRPDPAETARFDAAYGEFRRHRP